MGALSAAPGDGIADATPALQAAIDAAVTTEVAGARVVVPPGTYGITAPLVVPYGYGIEVHGAGRLLTTIVQHTANTPILSLTTDPYLHHLRIADLSLTYAAHQTAADTDAACITIGGDATSDAFALIFERIVCARGFRGIVADTSAGKAVPWGVTIRDCTFQHLTGSAIRSLDIAGKPNWRLENLYIANTGGGPTPIEPAIHLAAVMELVIQNLDIEGWNYRHLEILGGETPILIDGYHMENSTFGDEAFYLNYIANSGFIARGVSFSGTVAKTYGSLTVFLADGNPGSLAQIAGMHSSAVVPGAGSVYPLALAGGAVGAVRGITGAWTANPIDPNDARSVAGLRQVEQELHHVARLRFDPSALPKTCTVGDLCVDAADTLLKLCTAPDTWTTVGPTAEQGR